MANTPQKDSPLGHLLAGLLLIGGVAFVISKCTGSPSSTNSSRSDSSSTSSSTNPLSRTLQVPGGSEVILFLSKKAASDATVLSGTAGGPAALARHVSCIVASGTKAVVVDSSFGLREVVVDSGPRLGCRGWVVTEFAR